MMNRRHVIIRYIGGAARKFRAAQEEWILPWWGSGGLASVPFWALDTLVLVTKLFSAGAMAVVKVLIPPVMKSLNGETVLVSLKVLVGRLINKISLSKIILDNPLGVFDKFPPTVWLPGLPFSVFQITGSGHGLGRELAIQLAELGATVICWDNDTRRNTAVVEEIRSKDGESYGFTVDITARDQVAALAMIVRRQLNEVTMVISNAGAITCAPITLTRPESIAKVMEVNLMAHFWIIQAFLPSMIERRYGHIVAINSSAGLMPCADMVAYCAAKSGLKGLMESLSEELRLDTWTKNINTTTVYLATVSTGMYPSPSHRFTSFYSEITAKEAAKTIIDGIRKNHRCISIPRFMKFLIDLLNLMPYRTRIILSDFFNFSHRGWFCFC